MRCRVDDDPDPSPDERLRAWREAFDDPAVERVDLIAVDVRVRLWSGVELEWSGTAPDHPKGDLDDHR